MHVFTTRTPLSAPFSLFRLGWSPTDAVCLHALFAEREREREKMAKNAAVEQLLIEQDVRARKVRRVRRGKLIAVPCSTEPCPPRPGRFNVFGCFRNKCVGEQQPHTKKSPPPVPLRKISSSTSSTCPVVSTGAGKSDRTVVANFAVRDAPPIRNHNENEYVSFANDVRGVARYCVIRHGVRAVIIDEFHG